MGRRSIRFKRIDDEGKRVYELVESHTIYTTVRVFDEDRYDIESKEMESYNHHLTDIQLLSVKNPPTREQALQQLIDSGLLYSDGTSREYDENGDLIPLSVLKLKRAQEKGQ